MTQKSWPWSTVTGLGDGSSELGESDSRLFLATLFGVQDPTSEGVVKGVLNELEVTGAASPLQVDTGAGIAYGLYYNDAAVNVAVPTPALGTTGGRIVLQTNWAGTGGASLEARTRIALKSSTDGDPSIPSLTQSVGTTWEISLAYFTITTGGVISLTDDRTFRVVTAVVGYSELETSVSDLLVTNGNSHDHQGGDGAQIPFGGLGASSVGTSNLVTDSVDDTIVGNRVPRLDHRQGGNISTWSTPGSTNRTPGYVQIQAGSITVSISASTSGSQGVTFPTPFSFAPLVFLSHANDSQPFDVSWSSINGNGFQINLKTADGVSGSWSIDVHWQAIGPPTP